MASSSKTKTEFQRFEALTKHILTTPKSDLVKGSSKRKTTKHRTKKRK